MAIESISELGSCTDVKMLKKQRDAYRKTMSECCSISPNCKYIAELFSTDPIVRMYISAICAKTSMGVRIRELEGENDD